MSKFLSAAALVLLGAGCAYAEGNTLGRPALPEEIAAWDIDVRPDGLGLPVGSGSAIDGEVLFTDYCASCHGDFGEGVGRWPVLAGGFRSLESDRPVKTIGSYWPYLSTVFDYVRRAMPFGNAHSLGDDEVYAITAYLLYLNDQVAEDFELSNENFTSIHLPNETAFYGDDREETEFAAFSADVCMENCKPEVTITMRARVLDVTPDTDGTPDGGGDLEGGAPVDAATADPDSTVPIAAIDAALAERGEATFKKCKSCHQVGEGAKNRSGPQLNQLIGRPAGAVDGFRYSPAMVAAGEDGLVWTAETLADFLAAPRAYVKGTKMSFNGLKDTEDATAVVEYLKTFAQ